MAQHDGCEGSSASILVVMVIDGREAFVLARARARPLQALQAITQLGFGSNSP